MILLLLSTDSDFEPFLKEFPDAEVVILRLALSNRDRGGRSSA
jgi:hypothetical protein